MNENEGFFGVSTVISLLAKVFGQQEKSQTQQLQNTEALIYNNQAFQRFDHVWDTLTTYVPLLVLGVHVGYWSVSGVYSCISYSYIVYPAHMLGSAKTLGTKYVGKYSIPTFMKGTVTKLHYPL